MAAVAEPAIDLIDDRLAARNALVLARGAGAGRRQQHRDRRDDRNHRLDAGARSGAGDRCRSASWSPACGSGTIPVGMLAKAFGRRFALQTGSAFGVLSGLISCAAVLHGSFWLLLRRHFVRRPLRGGASILSLCRHRYGEPAVPAQGGGLGAGRRHFRRRDRLAARHLHQGRRGRLICSPAVPGAIGLRRAGRDRAGVSQNSRGRLSRIRCATGGR